MADSMGFEAKSMAQQAKGAAGDVSDTAKGKLKKYLISLISEKRPCKCEGFSTLAFV